MPSLDQGRFIDAALESLLGQHYPDLEILVVDGGSSDDTAARLRRYGDRIAWTSEADDGQADALRKGFARATKPWLAWLNADDMQCGRALWALADAAALHPEAEVIYGRGHFIDEAGCFIEPYPTVAPRAGAGMARAMFESGYVAQPSVFFRRTAYDRVGGIDPGLVFVMDYDLWIRFARAGMSFAMIDRDLSANRRHGSAKTIARLGELYAEAACVQRRHYGKVSPYFVQASSDHAFRNRHGGDGAGGDALLRRWLYYKAAWIRLNAGHPAYCLHGLLREALALSGPIVGDRIPLGAILRRRLLGNRRHLGAS
jgi:glycosyltransferase involved in cell wall biosynthesis